MEPRGLRLEVTEAARAWLLAQNDHPEWGARPLRRIIRRHVREPLADYLLAQAPATDTMITLDVGLEGLSLSTSP